MPDDATPACSGPDIAAQPTLKSPLRPDSDVTHQPGETIGHYKILEVLGEGGFGIVYLAEQTEPVRRRVALKIIKPGMDSKAVIARFEAERQALAMMSHPNVAKVLDAGTTPMGGRGGGRPYFVMEHVKGAPITEYCDKHRLTVEQRLKLFAVVCEAVQHAHMKGIIHRDLKPSNILVAIADGDQPRPVVIDFGVAKALAGRLSEQTIYTERGMLIGTPEYMSPEQAEMAETDIDTRSDVYSLGVILYELLSGAVPFASDTLRAAGIAAIQKMIREAEPPRPSTKLSTIGEANTAIAAARQAAVGDLASTLRRELEWIPLKALRKDRAERYRSASELADDVQNYLAHRPLIAGPESTGYKVRKFVRRNKGAVAAAGMIAVTLVLATGVSVWFGVNEARQRAEAVKQTGIAEANAAEAKQRADELKQVSEFQSSMLSQIDTTKAGIDLMADVRERFAAALEKAGMPEEDRTKRLDALRQELVRVNATDTAAAMIDRTILKPAVAAIDTQFKDQPAVDAQLRQALADLYTSIGLYDAAYPLQESALATRRRVLGEEHPDTLTSISNTGLLLQSQGKLDQAERYNREGAEKLRRVLGVEHAQTLNAINNMSTVLYAQGKLDEAEPYAREALEIRRRVLGREHPDTLISISNVGALLEQQNKPAEAELYYREALEIRRRVMGEEHPSTMISISNLGYLLEGQGKPAQAEPYYREALEKSRRVMGEEHPNTLTFINNLGFLLQSQGKLTEAEPYWREALQKRRRVLGEDHPSTLGSLNNMGVLLRDQGKPDQAEPYFREAMESARRVLGAEHPTTLAIAANLGRVLQVQNKHQDAIDLLAPIEPTARKVFTGGNATRLVSLLTTLGRARVGIGFDADRFRLAEANLLEAHPVYLAATNHGPTHKDTLACVQGLVDFYTAWHAAEPGKGYDTKAAEWKAKLPAEATPKP